MQDRYAGDVGDFGKYGLLRALFSDLPADRPLGVIWYLVPNETNERTRNDGRYTEYLHRPGEFRRCDPSLFDQLGELLLRQTRSVATVQARSILPSGTRFFSEALVLRRIEANTPEGRKARAQHREAWVSRALAAVEGGSAIFLDPDNGLEVASIGAHAAKGPKYVTYNEVAKCVARSETVVIYHHLNRHKDHGSHENQMRDRHQRLATIMLPPGKVFALRFNAYQPRAYFVLAKSSTADVIDTKIRQMLTSSWGRYFERLPDS